MWLGVVLLSEKSRFSDLLLTWLPAQARLYDGFCSCVGSLVRLTRWLRLGTTLSSRQEYE